MSKAMTAASKEQLVELMQYLSQNISVPTIGIGGGFAPIGTIISYMGTTAPQDYLICDGTTYNIADYKQLSDFFAAQFGSANFFGGDGVTTFKVPDLCGEFLRGTGTNSHTNQGSGANVGVHQDGTEIPIMGAWYTDNTNKVLIYEELKKVYESNTTANSHANADSLINSSGTTRYTYNSDEKTVTSYPGSEVADRLTVRPTNTSVLYCIKAVAAGDVYSTTERVVGTWIDGKPVYEKTIAITSPTVTEDGTVAIDVIDTISNLKKNISINGYLNSATNLIPLPMFANNSGHQFKVIVSNNGEIKVISSSTSFNNFDGYAVIRYTKTTD